MIRKLTTIFLLFMILWIVLGGPLVAKGEIAQNLIIGVKQDSGGGFTNADLNDRYWFRRLGIHNFETSYREAQTCYGYIDFNGAGSWAGGGTCFDSDGTSGAIPSFNGTYSVNTNGSFTFIFNEEINTGHISSDRNFAILSDGFVDSHGIHQGIVTAVKAPDNPFSRSDLNGTWQERDLEVRDFEEDFREASACKGTIVINNPNWNGNFNCFESDGTTDIDTVSGTYTITGNTFDFFITGYSAVAFSAYLSRDGNILTFTHGSSSFGDIGLFKGIALKKTTKTFTNADLSGTYFIHGMNISDIQTNDRGAETIHGTLTSDGAGNWALTGQNFESDGTSASGTISGTYSVKPDGSFTVTVTSSTPNSTLTGNISGDNNTIILSQGENINDGWVTIQGTVTYNGTPLCAMVLANGQYMFSCGENQGKYELDVPLDENGEITLFAFVDGLSPFKVTSEPSSLPSNIEMELASPDSKTPTVTSTVAESIDNPGWVEIAGSVSLEGTPLCAMVLANGQYMFSCGGNGEYQLTVPLDPNGEITLFVFVDGLQPYKQTLIP